MRHYLIAVAVAAALAVGAAAAEQAPPAPSAKMLLQEGVSGDAKKEAVVNMTDWPVGATTGRHIHPGDEYATVLEGELQVTTDGKGTKTYKAGEAYHNARGVIHETRNAGKVPAKSLGVFIVDKGVPRSQPVK